MFGGYYTTWEVRCQDNFWEFNRRVISLDRIDRISKILFIAESVEVHHQDSKARRNFVATEITETTERFFL